MAAADSSTPGRFATDSVPVIRNDFAREDVGGEAVVWSPLRADPVALDPVSSVLLDVIDGVATVGEIADDVVDVVGVSADVALAQVTRCLRGFDSAGILSTSIGDHRTLDSGEIFLTPPNT